jgi:hypothetical protein
MDESIELKLLRLKKMKQMLASKSISDLKASREEEEFDKYLNVFRGSLTDRGEEVLEAYSLMRHIMFFSAYKL